MTPIDHAESGRRTGKRQITLARVLSKYGIASRSRSLSLILGGKVSVNGRIVRSPGRWVDPRSDRIALDGKAIRRKSPVYLAMNKPVGIVTTRDDERGRRTIYDLLPEHHRWVFPVGRLDKDSSGLLLLTNDTRFGDMIQGGNVPKTYAVEVNAPLRNDDLAAMEAGMTLDDGVVCLPVMIRFPGADRTAFEITLREGKNRQIRRMCAQLGYDVRSLVRISIGPVALGSLAAGNIRPLTGAERSSFQRSSAHPE